MKLAQRKMDFQHDKETVLRLRPDLDVIGRSCASGPRRPDEIYEQAELEIAVRMTLRCLTPLEETVIMARFGIGGYEEMTLERVAAFTCREGGTPVCKDRIRQIEKVAFKKLRYSSRSSRMRQHID